MEVFSQLIFCVITLVAIGWFVKKLIGIRNTILLGKPFETNDQSLQRWKNVLLLAFGQKKMFRKPLVALMHLIVYVGFIVINIELLEIIADGILGTHRVFEKPMGVYYQFLINTFEILAVLVLAACIVFLVRRNILKLKRFLSQDLNGWPRSDANYILIVEIILMCLFLTMNGAEVNTSFMVSSHLKTFFTSSFTSHQLQLIEHTAWWLHIIGIYAFMNYLPYSKHLHIILAFPNAYYAPLEPKGTMHNMTSIQNEVLYAMQPELAPSNATAPKVLVQKKLPILLGKI
jgi:hypothetical protein